MTTPAPEPQADPEVLRLRAASVHGLADEYVDLLGAGTEEELLVRAERLGSIQDDLEELAALREARDASGGEVEEGDSRLVKARQEAKNLRTRLHEAEAERDGLRADVQTMQRAEAVRLVSGTLRDPEDLFRGGVEMADLLAEDGGLDRARVDEAVGRVLADHPHWAGPAVPGPVPGLTPGSIPDTPSPGSNWQKVLQGG